MIIMMMIMMMMRKRRRRNVFWNVFFLTFTRRKCVNLGSFACPEMLNPGTKNQYLVSGQPLLDQDKQM